MILKIEDREYFLKGIKEKIFMIQFSLMKCAVNIPLWYDLVFSLISFIPIVSIMFVTAPFSPTYVDKCFNIFTHEGLIQNLGLPASTINQFLMIFQFCLLITILLKVRNPYLQGYLDKFLYAQLQIHLFLIVPITDYSIENIKNIGNQQSTANIINLLIISVNQIFVLGFILIFVKLQFHPLRLHNKRWKLSNQKQFYHVILNICRIVLINFTQSWSAFLAVSLVAQLYLRNILTESLNFQIKSIADNQSNLIVATHIALLISAFTDNQNLSGQIFLFLIIACIISRLFKFAYALKNNLFVPLCNNNCSQFYNFFYRLKQKDEKNEVNTNFRQVNKKQDEQKQNLIKIHTINCKIKNCRLQNYTLNIREQQAIRQIQIFCHQFIQSDSQKSKENSLICQLWKFQLGLKNNLCFKSKTHDLNFQYIIYVIQSSNKFTGDNNVINSSNIAILKTTFLDKLQLTTQLFSKFYQEISRPQPKLDLILSIGTQINNQVKLIKNIQIGLIKNSAITFKMAELYMEFQLYVNADNSKNTAKNVDKIKKIQRNVQILDIEDLYLPAIKFYPQNGNIENANIECLSFLAYSKFQLKSQNVCNIFYPKIRDINSLTRLSNQQNSKKIYTFLSKGVQNEYQFSKISVRQKISQNKKINYLIMERQAHCPFKNILLIKKNTLQIVTMLKKQPLKSYNFKYQKQIRIDWQNLYKFYLITQIELLIQQKIKKVKINQYQSQFMLNFYNTTSEDYFLIEVKYIKNISPKIGRNSSFSFNRYSSQLSSIKPKSFLFFYDIKQDQTQQSSLCGTNNQQYRNDKVMRHTKSLGKIQKGFQNLLVFNTIFLDRKSSKDIKIYRLWKKDLYNVDLQDKQRYNQLFEQHVFQNSQNQSIDSKESDFYFVVAAILVCSVVLFLCVYMLFSIQSSSVQIKQTLFQIVQIQKLKLYFFQIIGFTRDAQQGFYDKYGLNWQTDVLWAYQNIGNIRNKNILFSSIQRKIQFQNNQFIGNTNQLLDIVLQRIYYITDGFYPLHDIQDVHKISVQTFSEIFNEQINMQLFFATSRIQNLKTIQIKLSIIETSCFFFYFLMILWMLHTKKTTLYDKLKSLMMMSDSLAIKKMQNADKLKYAVQMIKKNFDLNFKQLLQVNIKSKNRKKPKEIHLGTLKQLFLIIAFLVFGTLNIWLVVHSATSFSTQISKIEVMHQQTHNFMSTYLETVQISNYIDHTGIIDQNQIQILMKIIGDISFQRQFYQFNADLSQFTNKVLFQNSCQYLIQKNVFEGQTMNCKNSTPCFSIQNPLELGMIYYFRRIQYNLINNITDTNAATGIFSKQFVKIYAFWSNLIQINLNQLTTTTFSTIQRNYWILISVSLIYIAFIIALNIWTNYYVKQVSQIINLFTLSLKNYQNKFQKSSNIKNKQLTFKTSAKHIKKDLDCSSLSINSQIE